MKCAIYTFIAFVCLPSLGFGDAFETQLDYLRRQELAVIGRKEKLRAYQDFISSNSAHPNVAEAIFDVGVLYESATTGPDDVRNEKKALEYYRAALQAAQKCSPIWRRAMEMVALRSKQDANLAINLLTEIQDCKAIDSVTSIRIEFEIINVLLEHSKLQEAERRCRLLVEKTSDKTFRNNCNVGDRIDIDIFVQTAICFTIRKIAGSPLKAGKPERILALANLYSSNQVMVAAQQALRDVERKQNVPSEHSVDIAARKSESWWRLTLIVGNGIAIIAILIFLKIKRSQQSVRQSR